MSVVGVFQQKRSLALEQVGPLGTNYILWGWGLGWRLERVVGDLRVLGLMILRQRKQEK